jgi:hypothetical protein
VVKDFAEREQARFTDRSAGVQHELEALGQQDFLKAMGGKVIMLSVTKPGQYDFSVTNIGLKEKLAMGIGFWGEPPQNHAVDDFLTQLGKIWDIEKFSKDRHAGVLNEPPC